MIDGPILYITFDGVLQPLAYSQVIRVVTEIARRGFPYLLLSVERAEDLERADHVARVRSALAAAGVEWHFVQTDERTHSAGRSGAALARVGRTALQLARSRHVRLTHARGYLAALVARGLQVARGTPYVFDVRACWIEERSAPGDWFSTPGRYAAGKYVEQTLLRSAAAIVTLTELQATDVRLMLGSAAPTLEVVPTCADYAFFDRVGTGRGSEGNDSVVPRSVQDALADKTIVGILGAINRSYRTEESLRMTRLAMDADPRVHLLVLSRQREQYATLAAAAGVPEGRMTISECSHEQMPDWLAWIDWGVLLLDDTAAKRGSVPTKLAEFFAAGVRPVAFGCNSEMTGWIRHAGSGYVLDAIDDASLAAAARAIAAPRVDASVLQEARQRTQPHFGLVEGADRYERLLRRTLTP